MNKLLRIQSNRLKPERGRILIAEPFMGDYYFGRSVVLLVEHKDEEGTFGVVMNKPSGSMLNDLVKDFPDFKAPVFIGGPVQTDSIFYMHTLGDEIPGSEQVIPGLYWGGELEALQELMTLGIAKPSQIRFFLGYSGWDAMQLSTELKHNSWLVSETNMRAMMQTKSHNMWNHVMIRMGPAYDIWRRYPVDPEMN